MRKPRPPKRPARLLFAIAGLLLAAPVLSGTWQWRDAAGQMVYSDQPPPSSVPTSRIVRAPAPSQGGGAQPATAAAAAARAAVPTAVPTAPGNWIEKEQASRKRALEREEAERRQAADREQAARNVRACEEARGALRTLDSGLRVSYVDERGERQILDDAARARRAEAVRQEITRNCSGAG